MTHTIVIGDGPGGLSAALFLAKNGQQVTVFGTDDTAMHYAMLHNYLGVPATSGTEFQGIARRQVAEFGAELASARVASVTSEGNSFRITTDDGASYNADYVVLTEGKDPQLALMLGVATGESGNIAVNQEGRTSVDNVYVVGRAARPSRSQAIISAGAGASAALDILSREAGKDVQDWDTPPKES